MCSNYYQTFIQSIVLIIQDTNKARLNVKIRRFPSFNFKKSVSKETTQKPTISPNRNSTKVLKNSLNKITTSSSQLTSLSEKRIKTNEDSTSSPTQSTSQINDNFSHTKVAGSSLYSVGYILNPSTKSNQTTTTFSPTTLDYTTPFTTATKSQEQLRKVSDNRNMTKGNDR